MVVAKGMKLTPLGQRMVVENMGLAYSLAFRARQGPLDADERVSVALEALIRAVIYYESACGTAFSTYASRVISNSINRATLYDRTIKVHNWAFGTRAHPDVKAKGMQALAMRSLDSYESIDAIEPAAPEADEVIEPVVFERLKESIDCLPSMLRYVVRERMVGRTLKDIGEDMGGLTKQRVHQMDAEAKRIIRAELAGVMS